MSGLDSEGFFARKLASNDSRTRAKTLRRLKKWMTARCENGFTELQMMKLWKGLHVCMWHSDKPLVQEELADSLASFIHVLKNREVVLLFIKCFFAIMAREWHGIDRLRLDKFYMLMRRVLRQSFQHLADKEWEDSYVKSLTKVLAAGPLNPDLSKTCSGIQLHVLEVYLPELLAVAATSVIPGDCSCWLLQPCCELLARTKDPVVAGVAESRVISQLVVGNKARKLNVDAHVMSEMLLGLAIRRDTVGRNRRSLYNLRQQFQDFAKHQQEQVMETSDQSDEGIEVDVAGEVMESEERKRDRADNKEEKMKKEDDEKEESEMEELEGEEMVKEGEEERGREELKTKRTTCGEQSYRDKLELARLIRRRLRRKKARGWAWGERVVVNYGLWRGLGVDEVLDWVEETGGRDETREGGWGEREEDEGMGEMDGGVARDGDHGDIATTPKGVARDGDHGNQTPSTRPKKRVSFGLHKNQIFTPQ